jgi:uncharacterized delta-60 repeat protein
MVVFGPNRTYAEALYAGGNFSLINGSNPNSGSGGFLYATKMDGSGYNKFFFQFDKEVYAITPYYTSDGTYQILVGGGFSNFAGYNHRYLIRLDGTTADIDTTFDTVYYYPDGLVRAIAVSSDDNIYIGGDFTHYYSYTTNFITKLSGGTNNVDTSWYSVSPAFNGVVRAIVVQPDGKILVGGDFTSFSDTVNGTTTMAGIIRLNSDGTYDTTFNLGYGGFNNIVRTIALLPNGQILVGGDFIEYYDFGGTWYRDRVCRLNANGTFDTDFNHSGVGANDIVNSIVVDPLDRILVGGAFTTYTDASSAYTANCMVRLKTNGTYDPTFDTTVGFAGGVVITRVNSIVISYDKVFVGGDFYYYRGSQARQVVRLNFDGSKDATYVTNIYEYDNGGVTQGWVNAVLYRRTYL